MACLTKSCLTSSLAKIFLCSDSRDFWVFSVTILTPIFNFLQVSFLFYISFGDSGYGELISL